MICVGPSYFADPTRRPSLGAFEHLCQLRCEDQRQRQLPHSRDVDALVAVLIRELREQKIIQ
jgi:hypothetical protein